MSAENKVSNLALIGKGRWGKNYLKGAPAVGGVVIKYTKTHDYKDLLNYTDIDGIIIATPAQTHYEVIKTFPDKYLLVEKPLTTNLSEANAIKNRNIMTGHTYLFNAAVMEKALKVGDSLKFKFVLHNTDSYGSQVGPIWELAPHPISLLLKLVGPDMDVLDARLDNGNLIANIKVGKCLSEISVGWNFREREREILIVGEKSSCRFDGTEVNQVSPLQNEIASFVNFIHGGENISTLEDGVKVVEILTEIEKLCTM